MKKIPKIASTVRNIYMYFFFFLSFCLISPICPTTFAFPCPNYLSGHAELLCVREPKDVFSSLKRSLTNRYVLFTIESIRYCIHKWEHALPSFIMDNNYMWACLRNVLILHRKCKLTGICMHAVGRIWYTCKHAKRSFEFLALFIPIEWWSPITLAGQIKADNWWQRIVWKHVHSGPVILKIPPPPPKKKRGPRDYFLCIAYGPPRLCLA